MVLIYGICYLFADLCCLVRKVFPTHWLSISFHGEEVHLQDNKRGKTEVGAYNHREAVFHHRAHTMASNCYKCIIISVGRYPFWKVESPQSVGAEYCGYDYQSPITTSQSQKVTILKFTVHRHMSWKLRHMRNLMLKRFGSHPLLQFSWTFLSHQVFLNQWFLRMEML